jgi:hypothetical protein
VIKVTPVTFPPGPVEACLDRVGANVEDDRDRRGRGLGGEGGLSPARRKNDRYPLANKIGR